MVLIPKLNKYICALGLFILISIFGISEIYAQDSDNPFQLPEGSGEILVGGGLEEPHGEIKAIKDFYKLSGGANAKILIIGFGYSTLEDANIAVGKYTDLLPIAADTIILLPEIEITQSLKVEYTGIVILGEEHSLINIDTFLPIRDAWLAGIPILADRTGSAILGSMYSLPTQVQDDQDASEEPDQSTGKVFEILPGLDILNFAIEPYILSEDHWDRFNALSSAAPNLMVIGIPSNTFVNITQQKMYVSGESDIFVYGLDVSLDPESENESMPSNRRIEVFSPGAEIELVPYEHLIAVNTATPSPLPRKTGTPQPNSTNFSVTEIPEENNKKPTKTPKPTMTPPAIPPSQNVSQTNFMILFVVLAAIVVVVGVWINRERQSK